MEITKSNSSYGNWAIRLSETEIRFFFRKADAIRFLTPYVEFDKDSRTISA